MDFKVSLSLLCINSYNLLSPTSTSFISIVRSLVSQPVHKPFVTSTLLNFKVSLSLLCINSYNLLSSASTSFCISIVRSLVSQPVHKLFVININLSILSSSLHSHVGSFRLCVCHVQPASQNTLLPVVVVMLNSSYGSPEGWGIYRSMERSNPDTLPFLFLSSLLNDRNILRSSALLWIAALRYWSSSE
jgi:hypothetical protein